MSRGRGWGRVGHAEGAWLGGEGRRWGSFTCTMNIVYLIKSALKERHRRNRREQRVLSPISFF